MAVQGGAEEDVYATLLLSDTYLPGALVLAHSLRDAGTSKKLAILVTLDTVSAEVVTQVKTLYDYVIPVSRIRNSQPANLQLMNRADLHSAFTKINLWKQTQFRKIVYIDSDVVAYRAPDELFDLPHPFSAAPDIGWPDLFNTGVMVLTPNMGDYYAMIAMAERSISFDGADQGLINMHFRNNYNRLSFTYNVTPSGHYQYVPAYRHFQSGISMVHFIGPDKPWFKGRGASVGGSPYDEMIGRWWAVYDRHYRTPTPASTPSVPGGDTVTSSVTSSATTVPVPELVQYFTKGEYQPKATHVQVTGKQYRGDHQEPQQHFHHGQSSLPGAATPQPKPYSSHTNVEGTQAEAREEQVSGSSGAPPPPSEPEHGPPAFQPTMSSWDAQRQAPPTNSKPEAMNFPSISYEMSRSTVPFIPPERYPSPPRNMWYEVPKESPASSSELPKPIFPWEDHRPEPSRVFAHEYPEKKGTGPEAPSELPIGSSHEIPSRGPWPAPEHQASAVPSVTGASTTESKSEPATPTAPVDWSSFTFSNAWDEVPQIERYVDKLQKHKFKRSVKSPAAPALPEYGEEAEITWRRRGSKITDFPSELERPSLPVTPAPIHRPNFWGGDPGKGDGDDDNQLLPAAEGVPAQTEWDPVAQLQKLAKNQSEALLQKLGSGRRDSSDLPSRPLPFGSEELVSPTFVAQTAQVFSPQPVKGSTSSGAAHNIISSLESTPSATSTQSTQSTAIADVPTIQEPSYTGPGPAFEKGEIIPTENAPTPRTTAPQSGAAAKSTGIPEPSYTGPGPTFEKDENIPVVEEGAH